jgi:hypothetical protein
VTSEKVGVQVKGLAVYRVARPELAVRMLNFSFPERAQEKLGETLRDMFVGAARRLVANLSVEECLTRRKEALAAFLIAEIAPVVSGEGRVGDSTDKGWGVIIDTIEIQDVQVLSDVVFRNMQAPYRNALLLKARDSEITTEKETVVREAAGKRQIEEAKARAEAEMRELRAQTETAAAQAELAEEMKRLSLRAEAERARLDREREAEKHKLEQQAELARARAQNEREAEAQKAETEAQARSAKAKAGTTAAEAEARAEERKQALHAEGERMLLIQRRELDQLRQAQDVEAARATAEAAREAAEAEDALAGARAGRARERRASEASAVAEVRRLEAELLRLEGEVKAALAERQKATENAISLEKVQSDFVNRTLPEIARSFQQRFGEVKIISTGGENPFGFLVHAFDGVLEIARKSGLPQALTGPIGPSSSAAPAHGAGKKGSGERVS